MPIYSYRNPNNNEIFDEIRSFKDCNKLFMDWTEILEKRQPERFIYLENKLRKLLKGET